MFYIEPNKKGVEEIIVGDPFKEYVFEKGINLLIEANWNVNEAAKKFDEPNRRKILMMEFKSIIPSVFGYEENKIDSDNALREVSMYFEELENILHDNNFATEKLNKFGLVSDNTNLGSLDTVIAAMGMRPATSSPAGLYMAISNNYLADLDSGITDGLQPKEPALFKKVKEVWENAVNDLHPFQRGPTHQGTKHCFQVLKNLHALENKYDTIKDTFDKVNLEKRALMSMAVAIHDVGKGDLLSDPPPLQDFHAQSCARLILREPGIFRLHDLDKSCNKFISKVVETHNPEDQLDEMTDIKDCDIEDNRLNIQPMTLETKLFCALFQLADVMDTTKHRVSTPGFRILARLHQGSSGYYKIEKLVEARKGMIKRKVKFGSDYIEVTVCKDPLLRKRAESRIIVENKDLEKTGAQKILKMKVWPDRLQASPSI